MIRSNFWGTFLEASQEPTRSAVLAHGQPFVSHDSSSWLAIFSRTSLELVPLEESGRAAEIGPRPKLRS